MIVTIKWKLLNEICRSELVERLYQTLLTFLQHWIQEWNLHVISHYQNQFPALTWTCENMLAPSESSLEPPIIYTHIPRLHQPTNLNSPEAGISWNKRWNCIQEREGNEMVSGGKWKWRWTGTTRKTLSWSTAKYGASTVAIVSDQNVIVCGELLKANRWSMNHLHWQLHYPRIQLNIPHWQWKQKKSSRGA